MSVMFAAEPAGSRAALAEGLNALVASGLPSARAHYAAVSGASAPPPLPVHVWGLDDLAGESRRTEPASWKFLLVCGEQPVRSADVASRPDGGFEFASMSEAEAAAINNAIAAAEQASKTGKFELRLVRVPALYVTAVWLKNAAKGKDRFVVVPPSPEGFVALSIHEEAAFVKLLRAAAKRRAGTQDTGSPTN